MPAEPTKPALRRFIRMSRLRLIALLIVGLVLILSGISAWLYVPRTKLERLRITAGNPALNRQKVAEYFKRRGPELDLEVDIRPTPGTPEAVRLVEAGELDFALVNGLLRFREAKNVRQVATIAVERIHLLVKSELAKKVTDDYAQLKGLAIDIGPEKGESALLAQAVFKFLGLQGGPRQTPDTVRFTHLGVDGLLEKLTSLEKAPAEKTAELRAALPEGIFQVSTLPGSLCQRLVAVGKYDLIPLSFSRAFAQITVEEEETDPDHVDQLHTEPASIPAFTYGGIPPVPASECQTLGAPLILICHKDVPNEVVSRVLPRIYSGPLELLYHPPSLDNVTPVYPLHPASIAYRDKGKPLVRADIADLVRQILGGIAPVIGGCIALYGYYRWRQLLRFLDYFRELQELDLVAKGLMPLENLPASGPERIGYLESALVELQRKAIEDFCENYFYGDGVFRNFLVLMAETRDFLRRSTVEVLPTITPPASEPSANPAAPDSPVPPPSKAK